jgi:hypothetical protein
MSRTRALVVTALAAASLVLQAQATTRLFVISNSNLNQIDPLTGAVMNTTAITGSSGTIGAFAFDAATNTFFMSNTTNDNLWTLDITTGAATLVGPYNVTANVTMHGLAVDDTGQLYGYSSSVAMGARFFSIDRTTAQATPISDPGFSTPGSLEFVPSTQTMYFAHGGNDTLYTIDRTTGATTVVGPFNVTGQVGVGLAYDPAYGMYASNNSTNIGLYTLDLTTGAATLVSAWTGNPIALAFVPDTTTPSTPFCLGDGTGAACPCANTGAPGNGCASAAFPGGARLSSTGIAGASLATDTLVLTATDVPGPGLFFQANGLAGVPIAFGDGQLCAAAGIIRLGVVFPTAGVATYPGGLTPNPIHIQGSVLNGDTKHYQCWYRSVPGLCGVDNFNLTQGLTLVWGP